MQQKYTTYDDIAYNNLQLQYLQNLSIKYSYK